jgi:thiamine pyrophosphate-dependent acetolactate synthase large subunit-like protein
MAAWLFPIAQIFEARRRYLREAKRRSRTAHRKARLVNLFDKPVIVLGHGVRASGADASRLLELGVPIVSSWMGADLVDNFHPMYYGRLGIYGQRCANKVLYEANEILAIGAACARGWSGTQDCAQISA